MIDNFPEFARIHNQSFQALLKYPEVYIVDINGDDLVATYLAAFPEGTNPVFKKCTEHDCSCCKQVLRRTGNVVAIFDGRLVTSWDIPAVEAPAPYDTVSKVLRALVLSGRIVDLFRVGAKEKSFGNKQTRSEVDGTVHTHHHLYTGTLAEKFHPPAPDAICGAYRTAVEVFKRGLTELKPEAVDTVLSLIDSNSIYRGEEHKRAVTFFKQAQTAYNDHKKMPAERDLFLWNNLPVSGEGPLPAFRNSAIGTLVQDLSADVDVEEAVASFEKKTAPQNYKRSTAVVTPAMVKKAMAVIEDLGLEPALQRRGAIIGDVAVGDVLWVDNSVKPLMKGGLGDVLLQHVAATRDVAEDEKRAEPIDIEDFIKRILPEATGMEIFFKGHHASNLMTLTAPVNVDAPLLFKWPNNFAWSYTGNIADSSVKERVKRHGGQTNAPVRTSLAWHNGDDLDLHVYEPERGIRSSLGGNHIGYNTPYRRDRNGGTFSPLGGQLDVDMNAGAAVNSTDPVENIYWREMHAGKYRVDVNNFAKRSSSDVGFTIEVEVNGKASTFTYSKALRNAETITVVVFEVHKDGSVTFEDVHPGVTRSAVSVDKWGIKTETYTKVNVVTRSPNYWGDSAVGNKHTFFILDGAKSDEDTRGIYNEFLKPSLEPHRKVFELIGDKTKSKPVDGQLSGLGFSSTKSDSFIVKVMLGKKQRIFNVKVA